jgi:hypothetical protein
MESLETSLPIEERTRKACQEPRREGRINDREAKFPFIRYDNTSAK